MSKNESASTDLFRKICWLLFFFSGEPAHLYVGIVIADIDNIYDAKMVTSYNLLLSIFIFINLIGFTVTIINRAKKHV